MDTQVNLHADVLDKLNRTVLEAAAYFGALHENTFDGHDNAHAVLSQLVFWHEQYVAIARALVEGHQPQLNVGTFARLNEKASVLHAGSGMVMLAYQLSCAQRTLTELLSKLPNWSVDFPIKQDSPPCTVAERVDQIEQHIRQHVMRMRNAEGY